MARIGVAVVGAGFMGAVHVEALRRAGCEVVGVLGVSDAESTKFAGGGRRAKAYRSLRGGARGRRPSSRSTSPRRTGCTSRWPRPRSSAGKHVLCEKPLAMNSTEIGRAGRAGPDAPELAAGVNYNIRFYPLNLEAARA